MGKSKVAPTPSEPESQRGGAYDSRRGRSDALSRSDSHEEGVEVVLGAGGSGVKVLPESKKANQNVFRGAATSSSRGRSRGAPRAPSYGGPPPTYGSGSFGYGPPPDGSYPPHPMTVPYNPSGSFDDHGYHQAHFSPHVQYPQPGGYPGEDINVISPSHGSQKGDSPQRSSKPSRGVNRRAPPPGYYHYPPTSPVSRPEGTSPPRTREGRYPSTHRSDSYHPDDGTWNPFPPTSDPRGMPPVVPEPSFESQPSYPPTPGVSHGGLGAPPTPTGAYGAHEQFYGSASWGSFDSQGGAPPVFDDQRYYGYPLAPDSPYPSYGVPPPHQHYYGEPYPTYSQSGEAEQHYQTHYDAGAPQVTPVDQRKTSLLEDDDGSGLPEAARDLPFDIADPPSEPFIHPSNIPCCHSVSELNRDDVLCGRGGGTNSQIGNRRFRQLVQDFQPIYLMARRKEKPRLARTIVMIIRGRGGRFLRKDEDSGMLFEVGDQKAEAKTSQALREGLDVRATKSAAKTLQKQPKKGDTAEEDEKKEPQDSAKTKKGKESDDSKKEDPKSPAKEQHAKGKPDEKKETPKSSKTGESTPTLKTPPSRESTAPRAGVARAMRDRTPSPPPPLPHLQVGPNAGWAAPGSPEALQFRKRRRMRSGEGCIPFEDKLFPDFCPPRADLCRTSSPDPDDEVLQAETPPRRNSSREHVEETDYLPQPGCADIAMMMMNGATGGFCFQPKWRD